MTVRIKNWSQFQHFKDRRPPWVKLYRDLLDDVEWHELEPKAAKALVMIWLIASESDGVLPDTKKLAFRLRVTEKDTKDILSKLSHWLDQSDISVISERYQVAPVADVSDHQERETETERDIETEKRREEPRKRATPRPDDVCKQVWEDWTALRAKKRTTVSETVIEEARSEAAKAGLTLERFLTVWVMRGSQGLQAEWLKPEERGAQRQQAEPAWRIEQRERTQIAAPGVAARTTQHANEFFIDMEVQRVLAN